MEKAGYFLIAIVALIWIAGMLFGMIAILPYGLVGLAAMAGGGLLLIKALKDRLTNREDAYYSKNVDQ